jgi:hypothetical protein
MMSRQPSTSAPALRRRFIEFIRELYAFLGHAAPALQVSDDKELAVELQVDAVRFFVVPICRSIRRN